MLLVGLRGLQSGANQYERPCIMGYFFTFQVYTLTHTLICICVSLS
jgi:hypothetical protein